jgi:hypothetical protein
MLTHSLSQYPFLWLSQVAALFGRLCVPPLIPSTLEAVIPDDGSFAESLPWHCCQ